MIVQTSPIQGTIHYSFDRWFIST